MIDVRWSIDHPDLLVGVVQASGMRVRPADAALSALLDAEIAAAVAAPGPDETVKRGIRDLLRRGGFSPTGRSKPASEYLANAAREGRFPRINNLVDVNNLLSLRTGWPMSLLDLDRIPEATTRGVELRLGHPGERYVFNAGGQEIDLAGLICVAACEGPAQGNPVKDSMAAKTVAASSSGLAVIWASRKVASPTQVEQVTAEFGALLVRFGEAEAMEWRLFG